MMPMQDTILRALLAREFGRTMTAYLTPRQMREANERNALLDWGGMVCHSHDFCDANMAMDEAFRHVMNRDPIADIEAGMSEADCMLWNDAWDIARRHRFWGDPEEAQFWQWQATQEHCADLGEYMADELLTKVPGLIYEGGYIEMPVGGCLGKRYYLLIERSEWESHNLEEIERILFFEWVLPNAEVAEAEAAEAEHLPVYAPRERNGEDR